MDKTSLKPKGDKKPMTTDDKFLASMKKKHDTKEVDKTKVSKETMASIMENIVQVPEKLHMTGSPDDSSVKKAKPGENQLHTGKGKQMLKSTMNASY